MKTLPIVIIASIVGGIVGSMLSSHVAGAATVPSEIRTTGLVLVNASNVPTARLGSVGDSTVLQFFNSDATVALEVGADTKSGGKFIHFLGENGRIVAALNSLRSGDTTLYLGDRQWQARVILGALESDVPTDEPSREWGLLFRRPGSNRSVFSVVMSTRGSSNKSSVGLQLLRSNGTEWSAP
jgi:hypothetical protein